MDISRDEPDHEEDLYDFEAASSVGSKVIEMADRVKAMHALVPGSQAVWNFSLDEVHFKVVVSVSDDQEPKQNGRL